MANTYNWKINRLDAKIHEDGLDNVIFVSNKIILIYYD